MLLTKEVIVKPWFNSSYYEDLGYNIPKYILGNHKKLMVSRKTIIMIKPEHLPIKSNIKIEYQCDNCNNTFKTYWYNYTNANKSKGDFCRECSLKVHNSGVNNPNYGKKLDCGFKKGAENYAAINLKGSNNPNYNPNLTNEERLTNRDTIENINWRKSVYQRDDYKCTICGESHTLEAHHLNSYTNFKDMRFDINNGVTLCKNHHKDYHLKFGYKDSTIEKFNEYKQLLNT